MIQRIKNKVGRIKDKIEVEKYYALDRKTKIDFQPEVLTVISRFDEDVDWCKKLTTPYIVYNKGKNDLSEDINASALRNVGREGHTILHFIITHYDNLPERVIFTQGDPFPHAPDFIEAAHIHKNHLPTQPLSLKYLSAKDEKLSGRPEYAVGIPDETILEANVQHNKGVTFYVETLDGRFNVIHPYRYEDPGIQCLQYIQTHKAHSFSTLCDQLGLYQPDSCYFNYAGILSVSKKQILRQTKSTYEHIMRFLLQDPEHGFLLERMWLTIFGYQPKNL